MNKKILGIALVMLVTIAGFAQNPFAKKITSLVGGWYGEKSYIFIDSDYSGYLRVYTNKRYFRGVDYPFKNATKQNNKLSGKFEDKDKNKYDFTFEISGKEEAEFTTAETTSTLISEKANKKLKEDLISTLDRANDIKYMGNDSFKFLRDRAVRVEFSFDLHELKWIRSRGYLDFYSPKRMKYYYDRNGSTEYEEKNWRYLAPSKSFAKNLYNAWCDYAKYNR